jgi:hypothetical protein
VSNNNTHPLRSGTSPPFERDFTIDWFSSTTEKKKAWKTRTSVGNWVSVNATTEDITKSGSESKFSGFLYRYFIIMNFLSIALRVTHIQTPSRRKIRGSVGGRTI